MCVCVCVVRTRGQQDDGGDNQGTDDEDDQQGDGDSFPVPLRRRAADQVLKNIMTDQSSVHTNAKRGMRVTCAHVLSRWGGCSSFSASTHYTQYTLCILHSKLKVDYGYQKIQTSSLLCVLCDLI